MSDQPNRPADRPFDLGLQTERTALSWQRTTLACAVALLLASRLLVELFGPLSFLFAAVGLVLTAVLFLVGSRRYRLTHTILVNSSSDRVALGSAVPLFAWAVGVFCLALVGLVVATIAATS